MRGSTFFVVAVRVQRRTPSGLSHESMEAVWLMDNPVKIEIASISVFGQLRQGCLYSMCVLETFDREAASAPVAFHFLIDVGKKNKKRLEQMSEVLNLKMSSTASAESFQRVSGAEAACAE